jgi:hypothetical protein
MISHLRDNVVAYLALMVALCGTSYAAVQIPTGSVTTSKLAKNAVTSPKIKNNSVTSPKIKNNSVSSADIKDGMVAATDLAVGIVPRDGFLAQAMVNAGEPTTTPDSDDILTRAFTLPRAGTAHIRFFGARFSATCTSGGANGGLYLDGAPVAGTERSVAPPGDPSAIELLASVPLATGDHVVAYGIDCTSGTLTSATVGNATWTVLMTAD